MSFRTRRYLPDRVVSFSKLVMPFQSWDLWYAPNIHIRPGAETAGRSSCWQKPPIYLEGRKTTARTRWWRELGPGGLDLAQITHKSSPAGPKLPQTAQKYE